MSKLYPIIRRQRRPLLQENDEMPKAETPTETAAKAAFSCSGGLRPPSFSGESGAPRRSQSAATGLLQKSLTALEPAPEKPAEKQTKKRKSSDAEHVSPPDAK
jgi:hypothetical protein